MSEWAPRRFWEKATTRGLGEGFGIFLDDRPLRTPAKAQLVARTDTLAECIAAEWRSQGERVDPSSMPFTRSLNALIDKVAPNPAPVAEMLGEYAETDLLCYRADEQPRLAKRQREVWDPYLDWADSAYGARLVLTAGIMPVDQPPNAVAALQRAVRDLDPYDLTAAHDLVTLSGSLILGLAGIAGRLDAETLWKVARLDELWQIEQWGEDEEAEAMALTKKEAISHALAFQAAAAVNA